MKAVILAGGFGTRLSEESCLKPKPMVEIGGKPILWHIMKIFSHYGINEFIVCLGYKGYVIKEYFANYFLHMADVSFDVAKNRMHVLENRVEPWRVTLVDTGSDTMTGGRLRRVRQYLGEETFCFTYGDGVCDVNIRSLISFHRTHRKIATVTATQPPGRYGTLAIEDKVVTSFREKPTGDGAWINSGFFVLEPTAIELIAGDDTIWEHEPLTTLAQRRELVAYKHAGFWQAMDTLRDKKQLEALWEQGKAAWKVWT